MNMQNQDFGYQTDRRVTIALSAPFNSYPQLKLDAMYRDLQQRLANIPGVKRAALAQYTPLQDNWGEMVIREGRGMPNMNEQIGSSWDHVAAGYLETMGENIVRGRSITDQDTASSRSVVVVNEAFVHRFFKSSEDPIGQRFGLDLPRYSSTFEIVGVVRNARYNWDFANREPPRPLFFVPLAQRTHYDDSIMQIVDDGTHFIEGAVLELETNSIEGLESQIRAILSDIDPNITLLSVQPLQEQVDSNLDQQRAIAELTGLFGFLALVLAAVGLYGVTAYAVERRTSEIGVRMALGADRGNVIGLVLRGAFLQILIGLAIGIPISIGCSRLIANQLYQVKGWDPLVLFVSVLALGICAFLASIIPAQRAASIDPVRALRVE
jgi:predicted permease